MELIPEGYYNAVAAESANEHGSTAYAHLCESKNGKKQVAVRFQILDGAYAGRTITWYGFFTTKTWERTTESLRYCGFRGNDILDVERQELRQPVSLTVEHDTYDGKTRAKVAWVNAQGGGVLKISQLDEAKRAEFAGLMSSKLAEVPEHDVPAVAAPSPADDGWGDSSHAGPDDDIPF